MGKILKTGWYVLYVRSHQEKKVVNLLEEKGLECFLPLVKTIRKWSDRKKTIFNPLFPSYAFVKINNSLDFHHALSTDGACSFIRFGNEYGRVSEKEIEQIKLLVGKEDVTELQANVELPNIGDKLRIEKGELSGLECEVYRVDKGHKISVWIKSLRQNISATIPAYYFQKSSTNYLYQ